MDIQRSSIAQAVCAAATIVMLAACGPVYDTQYHFTPPPSSEGRSCVFQCDNSRLQCRQLEDYKNEDCQRRAEYDQRRCEDDIYRRKGREPKWYECGSSSCSPDYDRCEQLYRSCYQSCGGRVDQQTVCVSGCDQIPPNQRQDTRTPPPSSGDDFRAPVKPKRGSEITPRTY